MHSITTIPNPILTTPSKPVKVFDKKLKSMVSDMKRLLRDSKNPKGVGLAGSQAGIPYQIFLTRPTEKEDMRVFINPRILSHTAAPEKNTEQKDNRLEGCLSIPHIWGKVNRHETVKLEYQDENGEKHEETFEGFMATIVQHEVDHIKGVLFTARALEQKNKLYQIAKDEGGKEVLEEITIQ